MPRLWWGSSLGCRQQSLIVSSPGEKKRQKSPLDFFFFFARILSNLWALHPHGWKTSQRSPSNSATRKDLSVWMRVEPQTFSPLHVHYSPVFSFMGENGLVTWKLPKFWWLRITGKFSGQKILETAFYKVNLCSQTSFSFLKPCLLFRRLLSVPSLVLQLPCPITRSLH